LEPLVLVGIKIILAIVDIVALHNASAAELLGQIVDSEPVFVEVHVKVVEHSQE